ncbi:NAD(P)-dependent oxidoreductase [Methylocystis sp. B8]|uniref:NAD-dependent epimerase/dehydratase family protein n=1 Tax=Methylocystis sp. B8 TaxID=544938 RepID=UPI001AEE3F42|nr:NAD(P)-dependent oxidoreductase [Methylocystis sp. B8]
MNALNADGWQVTAFSRQHVGYGNNNGNVTWRVLPTPVCADAPLPLTMIDTAITSWIFLSPIWVLPDRLRMLEAHGVRRIVALSSTSRFTKIGSSDSNERILAKRLAAAEETVSDWAVRRNVACTILRPTLIYGSGRDRNIAEMAAFIRRFGFFPVLGSACGLRQPVHVEDVAAACVAALAAPAAVVRAYNISGGEVLSYRDMASRVFKALDRTERLVSVPLTAVRAGVALAQLLPRFRHWSPSMAERMNQDMVFDHSDAERDLYFRPRPFRVSAQDVGATDL